MKKKIALIAVMLALVIGVSLVRKTPIGVGVMVPRVLAQSVYRVQCPTSMYPVASLNFQLNDSTFASWGCYDNTWGNLMVGSRVFVAPQISGEDGALRIMAAYNVLASTGGVIDACGTFRTATSIAFTSAKESVSLQCGQGNGNGALQTSGLRIIPQSTSVTPLLTLTGADTTNLASDYTFRNIAFGYATYSASQQCFVADKFVNLIIENVHFSACGQAVDLNYGFRATFRNNAFSSSGSGTTGALAAVRIENRTNTSTTAEQFVFDNCLWEGDTVLNTRNGIGLYVGPFTDQIQLYGLNKMDYYDSGTAAPALVLDRTNYVTAYGLLVSNGGPHPSTASAAIDIRGTSPSKSLNIQFIGGQVAFVDAQSGIKFDFSQNTIVTGINFNGVGGSHTGTAVTYTANASGTQLNALNTYSSSDAQVSDSSVNGIVKLLPSTTQLGTWNVGKRFEFDATLFASLGTPSNGTLKYCSDCTVANPCAGSGTGAIAKRLNGAWSCL
jgi:hypothetical protein